uniref:AraC family transcriptional regulator n=1 Tax=Eubacterium sp. TaxID=142586 RepID=UPI003FF055FD
MLVLILRQIHGEEKQENHGFVFESRSKGYVVKRIIAYMNENYSSHISLDQIAANMYLSPVYISKIFKEETGESPIRYLIKIRLEKAKEILENENIFVMDEHRAMHQDIRP